MTEPFEPPSIEEIEASGTADWVRHALDEHKKRSRSLADALDTERRAHAQEKKRLLNSLKSLPDPAPPEEDPPVPDIFAAEREQAQQQRRRMASLFKDLEDKESQRRAAERLFGKQSTAKRRKKRS